MVTGVRGRQSSCRQDELKGEHRLAGEESEIRDLEGIPP